MDPFSDSAKSNSTDFVQLKNCFFKSESIVMKCFRISLLFIIFIISIHSNFAASEILHLTVEGDFNITKKNGTLTSVEETNQDDNQSSSKKSLIIDDQELTSIKPFAFKKLRITELEIRFARKKLNLQGKSFAGLSKLEVLKFNSGIVKLKKNLFKSLGSLKKLYLTIDEDKSNLGVALSDLRNLKVLHIEGSNLKHIRADTFNDIFLPITHLTFYSNNITDIEPNVFASLKQLTSLRIEVNQLKNLRTGIFNGLNQLKELSLWSNSLTRIPKNIFNELMFLDYLSLHDNKIEKIEPSAFSGMDLITLKLQNNELTKIEAGMFEGLKASSLDLSSNKIVYIEDNAFGGSKVYRSLYLNDNMDIDVTNRAKWGIPERTEIYSITVYKPRPEVSKYQSFQQMNYED